MAAVTFVSLSAMAQLFERKANVPSIPTLASAFDGFRLRSNLPYECSSVRASNSTSRTVVHCMSTKTREIPSFSHMLIKKILVDGVYGSAASDVKRNYRYDPVFAFGFVTVYDQLMEGYPSDEDRNAIFEAYINALKEDPEQYMKDAQKLEEWACVQTPDSLVEFSSRNGEVEEILKEIAERAGGNSFNYSRFFAVGLFRLLELANATEPTILEKLCSALNVNKRSVDRDFDVYWNLLSKLVQAKKLLREYVDREKKKREERAESQKANEVIKKMLGTI